MKKIKFMMPALAIASTAAAITPFVTSCKNSGPTGVLSFETCKNHKWVEKYTPKYKALDKQKFVDQIAMAKAYAQDINANPEIFSDDFIYTYSNLSVMMPNVVEEDPKSEIITVSNGNIVNKWITYMKIDDVDQYVTTSLISFDLNIRRVVDKDENNNGIWDITYHYHNLPYLMYFGSGTGMATPPCFMPLLLSLVTQEEDAPTPTGQIILLISLIAAECSMGLDYYVKDLKDEYYLAQADFTLDAIGIYTVFSYIYSQLQSNSSTQDVIESMFMPLSLPVYSNYFSKAVQG